MNKLIIKHASELVTCKGNAPKHGEEMSDVGIIKDGAVVVENGKIIAVGTTEQILKDYNEKYYNVIDATNKAVLPGFVDSHTHFIFGGYRADEFSWRLRGDTYMSIMERGGGINNTVTATREASLDELVALGRKRIKKMLQYGVTTVEGKSGYGLDFDTEIKQLEAMKILNETEKIDVVSTFLGPHSVLPEYKGKEEDFIDFLIKDVMPVVKERNLAEFADIFTEKNVFSIEQSRKYLLAAKKMGFKLKIHADEIVDLGGSKLAAEVGCVSADHLLQASDEGIKAMAKNNVICNLLAITAFSLQETCARARYMIENGCAVSLASDLNPGSCFSNSIPLLIAVSAIQMKMSIEEIITALTINAASAVNRQDTIGSIEVGKNADIIVLEYPSINFLPYNVGVNTVETVIKNGEVLDLR